MKILHTLFLLGMMGFVYHPLPLSASEATNEIFYAQNQLTVHLKEANLKEVLFAVAKVAEVEFTIHKVIADEKVSVQFDRLPLEEGIKKVLRPFNHSIVFDSSGRLIKIIILESGSKSTTETIFEDHNAELSIALNQQNVAPSHGPGAILGQQSEGPPGEWGPGSIDLNQQDFDPSYGPGGHLDEASPEGVAGAPGSDGEEMRIPMPGVVYDPAVGPTGRLEDKLPENTAGPGGFLHQGQGPVPSMDNVPSSPSNSQ